MTELLSPPQSATDEDRRLFERVSGRLSANPSDPEVCQLASSDGIDDATAALYLGVRKSPAHWPTIKSIESSDITMPAKEPPRVVVMPGAFHVEYPHTGASGQRVLDLAAELGWQALRVALPSLAPTNLNAAALIETLAHEPGRPTIVVSLSKGGADVRAAFEREDAARTMRDVRGWVNLSGIVTGTPLVGWLLARPLRCCGVRLLLKARRQRFAALYELRRGPGAPLDRSFTIPTTTRVIHVAGFPLVHHLSSAWARRGHARLAALGPNDGGGILLNDVARLPGEIYPVWGCDHYLRPQWDIRPLLLNVLRAAARERPEALPLPEEQPEMPHLRATPRNGR